MKIAFVVEKFPVISETFIIDQVAGLINRGIEVKIFAFKNGDKEYVSDVFNKYDMAHLVKYVATPTSLIYRIVLVIPKILSLLFKKPSALLRALNVKRFGRDSLSLKLVFWAHAFLGEPFDLYHCHFGTTANNFLLVRDVLNIKTKFVTTFYGFDASRVFLKYGPYFYDRLKRECSLFMVMSQNMKDRIVAKGFDSNKVIVHPVGINPNEYPFNKRKVSLGEPVQIVSVGRFVEKKGFDDLLDALSIVRAKIKRDIKLTLVGDGPLNEMLYNKADSLRLNDSVRFRGYMKIEDIIVLFQKMHFFVQPSKTAKDGNME